MLHGTHVATHFCLESQVSSSVLLFTTQKQLSKAAVGSTPYCSSTHDWRPHRRRCQSPTQPTVTAVYESVGPNQICSSKLQLEFLMVYDILIVIICIANNKI